MNFLQINNSNIESIEQSFFNIASHLFNDFKIRVNDQFYRLLDIEFYYFSEGKFADRIFIGMIYKKKRGNGIFINPAWILHLEQMEIMEEF